jgi:hypothetical protein
LSQITNKNWNGLKQNQEVLQAWSNRGSVFFLQNKNRLHYAPVVQVPFGWPSHQSFCRNTWLCRGSWPCLPLISSGKVIVGFWTKMIGRLEGTFLELFFSICSSKLEASHTCLQKLQLFLKINITTSTLFIFHVFSFKVGCCRLVGDLLFIPVHAWQMYEHVIYMMNSPFEGWQYGRNSYMMEQESWFLPKLYNENFLSDDHYVTHKSWVQDASRRVCPYANNNSRYNLRTDSIHYVNMGRFSIWSQQGLISAQWRSS